MKGNRFKRSYLEAKMAPISAIENPVDGIKFISTVLNLWKTDDGKSCPLVLPKEIEKVLRSGNAYKTVYAVTGEGTGVVVIATNNDLIQRGKIFEFIKNFNLGEASPSQSYSDEDDDEELETPEVPTLMERVHGDVKKVLESTRDLSGDLSKNTETTGEILEELYRLRNMISGMKMPVGVGDSDSEIREGYFLDKGAMIPFGELKSGTIFDCLGELFVKISPTDAIKLTNRSLRSRKFTSFVRQKKLLESTGTGVDQLMVTEYSMDTSSRYTLFTEDVPASNELVEEPAVKDHVDVPTIVSNDAEPDSEPDVE